MDILFLLSQRSKYSIQFGKDKWLDNVLHSDKKEEYIILTEASLRELPIQVKNTYHLKAIFDLKNPFSGTDSLFYLCVLTREAINDIFYGIFYKTLTKRYVCHSKSNPLFLLDEYPQDYCDYLSRIDNYLTTESCPQDTANWEFGRISSFRLHTKYWNPNRYSKTVIATLEKLSNQPTVHLGTIARILIPHRSHSNNHVLCASPSSWKYPYNVDDFHTGCETVSPLQKDDIVISTANLESFFVYDQPTKEVHASQYSLIIRPIQEQFCAEYLFSYLNSIEIQTLLKAYSSANAGFGYLHKNDLIELPVLVPSNSREYYREQFYSRFPLSYFRNSTISQKVFDPTIQSSSKEAFVFISYSTHDFEIAEQTRKILEINNIPCWMAPQSIPAGSDYGREIPKAIDQCKAFVLLLSRFSQESNWVPKEVGLAIGKGKVIVPFQIDDASINDSFNFYLTNSQRISAYNRTTDAYQDLVAVLSNLLSE